MGKLVISPAARKRAKKLKHSHVHVGWNSHHKFYANVRPFWPRQIRVGSTAKKKLKESAGDVVLSWSSAKGFRCKETAPPKPSKRQVAVKYAVESLKYAGRMVYTEGPGRSELFNRPPGDFVGAGADCSQFVSSIMHWAGISNVNDQDATGTLLQKGKAVQGPAYARLVVFGPGGGVHTGMFTRHDKKGGHWYLTQFGDQAQPNEIELTDAEEYFRERGEPGVRFLDFFE